MKFKIDSKISQEYPDLKIGVLTAKGINNVKRISAIESLLRGASMQRKREYEKKPLDEDPKILRWREAYARFGAKPSKYQSSIEALLKRVTDGKLIPHINSLVDLYNHFSLKYTIPVGGEDMDQFYGDLKLTYAEGGECFRPIGTVDIKQVKPSEIVYKDKGGVIVRRWNYRECERTKLTKNTKNSIVVFEDLNAIPIDDFENMLYEFQDLIERYLGGDVAVYILNEDNNEIDLEVEGLKKADDSKISEKEKVHFIAKQEFEKKKDNKFEDVKNFVLSEYVYDKNNCLYCCTGKCTKHENNEKAKDLHPKIKNIIKNPKHLLGGDIKKTLDENNMDVHDKSIHMNTCVYNYKHPICKNCDDGRCKRMNHNGIELKICWPKLREESSVIPIGLHWDFSIEIKNNEIVIYFHNGFEPTFILKYDHVSDQWYETSPE